MAEENPMDRWQLRETGDVAKEWQLQGSAQPLNDEWQIYEDNAGITPWQPVEYERNQPQRGWLLPTLVIFALLAAIGYVGWLGYNRIGFPTIPGLQEGATVAETDGVAPAGDTQDLGVDAENPPTGGDSGQAGQEGVIVAETPVPSTATLPPPPPTLTAPPPPTPVMIEQKIATVAHPYGVNARSEPNTLQTTVLRIVPEGESGIVIEERDDWLKVLLPEDGEVWVSSQFMDISTELVEQVDPASPKPSGDASVQITAPAGLNARTEPNDGADVVQYLLADTVVPAVVYSDDTQWIMVTLEDGQTGWVFAEYVDLTGRIGIGLPEQPSETQSDNIELVDDEQEVVEEPESEVQAEAEPDAETDAEPDEEATNVASDSIVTTFPADGEVTSQDVITTGVAVEPPFTNVIPLDSAAIIIERDQGTNVRALDDVNSDEIMLLPKGVVLPILGKNAAGDWVQIGLPNGRQGWVFEQGVGTTQTLDDVPVIESNALEPTQVEEETGEGDDAGDDTGGDAEDAAAVPDADVSGEPNATARTLLAIYPSASNLQKPLDVILNGEELRVIGRSIDSRWVQIVWKDAETSAWILAAGITLDGDVEALSVTE